MFVMSAMISASKVLSVYHDSTKYMFSFSFHQVGILIPESGVFFVVSADPGFQFLYVLFWGSAVVFTLSVVFYYGQEFVDEPKLVHKKIKDKNV